MNMKFEMEFGLFNDKLVIETHDFDIIEIFQKFVEFQETHGWAIDYVAVELNDGAFEEEAVPDFALNAHEPL
jgi:hypothetical protein